MPEAKIDAAKAVLHPFVSLNPNVEIGRGTQTEELTVKRPWGDESVELQLALDKPAFVEALNHCILPERFAAIWHSDTKDFEIIYTAFPLFGRQKDLVGRAFEFEFGGLRHKCSFESSSIRLLEIAAMAHFVGPSTSDHRHLRSFWSYAHDSNEEWHEILKPISFWVRDLEWNQEAAVDLARHLNFYLTYYDVSSPTIDIHPAPEQSSELAPRERYVAGSFPTHIVARELNSALLHFWNASRTGDGFRRFLYSYQILEYAAYYYIDDAIKKKMRKSLLSPHILDKFDEFIVTVFDEMRDTRMWDGNKIEKIVREIVDPSVIWREVEKNREYFQEELALEGGCKIPALIASKTTKDQFVVNWQSSFCGTLRNIRNSLSHGKEQGMSAVIAPTQSNMRKLRPWVDLVSITAGEIMVYRETLF